MCEHADTVPWSIEEPSGRLIAGWCKDCGSLFKDGAWTAPRATVYLCSSCGVAMVPQDVPVTMRRA